METGNGVFDGVYFNFSDSVVKLSPAGTVLDYFTPFDQDVMQENDIDLGSSGPIILPDAVGSSAHPQLMIASGKVGVVYLMDQTNLGQYNMAANQDVGEVDVRFNTTNNEGGFYGQPAYWNGNIYTVIVGDSLRQYPISNGAISTVSISNSTNTISRSAARRRPSPPAAQQMASSGWRISPHIKLAVQSSWMLTTPPMFRLCFTAARTAGPALLRLQPSSRFRRSRTERSMSVANSPLRSSGFYRIKQWESTVQ